VVAGDSGLVDTATKQHVILWFALFFGLCFAVNATPVALAPTMVLKKQVRFLSLAVLGLIIVLWAWGAMIGTDAVGIWLMIASIPTAMILLLNLRRLRAVGHVVSAATLLLLFGLIASPIYAAFYALDVTAGPMRRCRLSFRSIIMNRFAP